MIKKICWKQKTTPPLVWERGVVMDIPGNDIIPESWIKI